MYIHWIYFVYLNHIDLYIVYLRYIPAPTFFYASAGPAAPEPPTMESVCLISSASSWMPKPAARHAHVSLRGPDRGEGTCERAVFLTANTDIGVSGSSRAFLPISKQV